VRYLHNDCGVVHRYFSKKFIFFLCFLLWLFQRH
jgi:hypothetical protein